jgi:hypothetical protein
MSSIAKIISGAQTGADGRKGAEEQTAIQYRDSRFRRQAIW